MKSFAIFVLSVALITPLWSHEDTPPPTPGPSESQLVEHGSYINKDGVRVHSKVTCRRLGSASMPMHCEACTLRQLFHGAY